MRGRAQGDRLPARVVAALVVLLSARASADAGPGPDAWPQGEDAEHLDDAGPSASGDQPRDAGSAEAAGPPDAGVDAGTPPDLAPALPPLRLPTVTLAGRVFARGSRDVVPGASVTLDGVPSGDTDEAGRFTLEVLPGRRMLQVQSPGFAPLSVAVSAEAGAPALELRLSPSEDGHRYETVVEAPPVQASRIALSREQITTTPGSLGDPFRVIESLPGVAQIVWPLPLYAVRGANPGNTGFLLDGLRVPALFHFALGPAVVHPHFLEGLDFHAGGYPARHGRYVAGVVAARTQAPPTDRVRGSVDVRLFDAGAILSSPIDGGRGSVAVAGRYAYPAGLFTLLQQNLDLHYWDYQVRADHALGPGRLTLFAFGSYDLLEFHDGGGGPAAVPGEDPAGDAERLQLSFHRVDLRWRGSALGGRLFVALGAGVDQTLSPYDDDGGLRARGKSLLPRLSFDRAALDWLDVEAGLDGELVDYDPVVPAGQPALAGFLQNRQVTQVGLYAAAVARLSDGVIASPGVRVDHYRESGATATDVGPRLNVRVKAGEGTWLKASGGRFSQMPSLPLQLPGFEGFGLGRHGVQTSWQAATGLESELPASLLLDTSVYLQRYTLTDLRDLEGDSDPLVDDFVTRRDALSYGWEVMLRLPPGARLHGWLSYTLSRSLRSYEGGVVADADWDQRHILSLVSGYRLGRWTLGGRFHLNTGRPVRVQDSVPVEFTRLPTFHQIDLRVDRRFIYDRFVLDVYLELVNTTLTRQVVALRRTAEGLEREGYRLVLPSLGVRAAF